jgi:hypothetical protein
MHQENKKRGWLSKSTNKNNKVFLPCGREQMHASGMLQGVSSKK